MFYKPICRLIAILAAVLLTGCAATNNYEKYYKPKDITRLTNVEYLKENQEPQIIEVPVNALEQTNLTLQGKGYVPISSSDFNGEFQDVSFAKAQAKRVKAVLVLVASKYTNTETSTRPLFLPNNQLTYGSGIVNNRSYSGTSTTYGSTVVPITTNHRRYDQGAIYYVKNTKKLRFGVLLAELTPEIRKALQRNTGSLVNVVVDGSPAFYANVLVGDVIIELEGKPVRSPQEALTALLSVDPKADHAIIKVLRNGAEKTIDIKF